MHQSAQIPPLPHFQKSRRHPHLQQKAPNPRRLTPFPVLPTSSESPLTSIPPVPNDLEPTFEILVDIVPLSPSELHSTSYKCTLPAPLETSNAPIPHRPSSSLLSSPPPPPPPRLTQVALSPVPLENMAPPSPPVISSILQQRPSEATQPEVKSREPESTPVLAVNLVSFSPPESPLSSLCNSFPSFLCHHSNSRSSPFQPIRRHPSQYRCQHDYHPRSHKSSPVPFPLKPLWSTHRPLLP